MHYTITRQLKICINDRYWNFAFNALGSSFYGMICAVAALVYTGGLTDEDMAKYLCDHNNIKGVGASVTSTVSSGLFSILAAGIYGWQEYGMNLGVGALFGLLFLFIGCTNKFAYQSKWDPNDTENNQKLENVSHILPALIQEENKAGTEETDQLVAKAGLSLQVICKSNSFYNHNHFEVIKKYISILPL